MGNTIKGEEGQTAESLREAFEAVERAESNYKEANEAAQQEVANLDQAREKTAALAALLDEESKDAPEYEDYLSTEESIDNEKAEAEEARVSKEKEVSEAEVLKRERGLRMEALNAAHQQKLRVEKEAEKKTIPSSETDHQLEKWTNILEKAVQQVSELAIAEIEEWNNATQYANEQKEALATASDQCEEVLLLLAVLKATQEERILLGALDDAISEAAAAKTAHEAADKASQAAAEELSKVKESYTAESRNQSAEFKRSAAYSEYEKLLSIVAAAEQKAKDAQKRRSEHVQRAMTARQQHESERKIGEEAGEKMRNVLIQAAEEKDSAIASADAGGGDAEASDSDADSDNGADVAAGAKGSASKSKKKSRAKLVDYSSVYGDDDVAVITARDSTKSATKLGRVRRVMSAHTENFSSSVRANISSLQIRKDDEAERSARQLRSSIHIAEQKALDEEHKWAEEEEKALHAAVEHARVEAAAWKAATSLAEAETGALKEATGSASGIPKFLAKAPMSSSFSKSNGKALLQLPDLTSPELKRPSSRKLNSVRGAAEQAEIEYRQANEAAVQEASNLVDSRGRLASLAVQLDDESKEASEYEDYIAMGESIENEKLQAAASRASKEKEAVGAEKLKRDREEREVTLTAARDERTTAEKAAASLAKQGNKGAETVVMAQAKSWAQVEDESFKHVGDLALAETEQWNNATQYANEEKEALATAYDRCEEMMLLLAVLKATQEERILLRALGAANSEAATAKEAYDNTADAARSAADELKRKKSRFLDEVESPSAEFKRSAEYLEYARLLNTMSAAEEKATEARQLKSVQAQTAASARQQREREEHAAETAGKKMKNVLVQAEEDNYEPTSLGIGCASASSDSGELLPQLQSFRKGRSALVDFGSVYDLGATAVNSCDSEDPDELFARNPSKSPTKLGRVKRVITAQGSTNTSVYFKNFMSPLRESHASRSSELDNFSDDEDKHSPLRVQSAHMQRRQSMRMVEQKAMDAEHKWAEEEENALKSATAYAKIECSAWKAAKPYADQELAALKEAIKCAVKISTLFMKIRGSVNGQLLKEDRKKIERCSSDISAKQREVEMLERHINSSLPETIKARESLTELKLRLDRKFNEVMQRRLGFEDEKSEYHAARAVMSEKETHAGNLVAERERELLRAEVSMRSLQQLTHLDAKDDELVLPKFDSSHPTVLVDGVEYLKPAAAMRCHLAAELELNRITTAKEAATAVEMELVTELKLRSQQWKEEEDRSRVVLNALLKDFFLDEFTGGNATKDINGTEFTKPVVACKHLSESEADAAAAAAANDKEARELALSDADEWKSELNNSLACQSFLQRIFEERVEDVNYSTPDWNKWYPVLVIQGALFTRPSICRRRCAGAEEIAVEAARNRHFNTEFTALNSARQWGSEELRAVEAARGLADDHNRALRAAKDDCDEELRLLLAARTVGEEEELKLDELLTRAAFRSSFGAVLMSGGSELFPGAQQKPFAKSKNRIRAVVNDSTVDKRSAALAHLHSGRSISNSRMLSVDTFLSETLVAADGKHLGVLYSTEAPWLQEILTKGRQRGAFKCRALSYMSGERNSSSSGSSSNADRKSAEAAFRRRILSEEDSLLLRRMEEEYPDKESWQLDTPLQDIIQKANKRREKGRRISAELDNYLEVEQPERLRMYPIIAKDDVEEVKATALLLRQRALSVVKQPLKEAAAAIAATATTGAVGDISYLDNRLVKVDWQQCDTQSSCFHPRVPRRCLFRLAVPFTAQMETSLLMRDDSYVRVFNRDLALERPRNYRRHSKHRNRSDSRSRSDSSSPNKKLSRVPAFPVPRSPGLSEMNQFSFDVGDRQLSSEYSTSASISMSGKKPVLFCSRSRSCSGEVFEGQEPYGVAFDSHQRSVSRAPSLSSLSPAAAARSDNGKHSKESPSSLLGSRSDDISEPGIIRQLSTDVSPQFTRVKQPTSAAGARPTLRELILERNSSPRIPGHKTLQQSTHSTETSVSAQSAESIDTAVDGRSESARMILSAAESPPSQNETPAERWKRSHEYSRGASRSKSVHAEASSEKQLLRSRGMGADYNNEEYNDDASVLSKGAASVYSTVTSATNITAATGVNGVHGGGDVGGITSIGHRRGGKPLLLSGSYTSEQDMINEMVSGNVKLQEMKDNARTSPRSGRQLPLQAVLHRSPQLTAALTRQNSDNSITSRSNISSSAVLDALRSSSPVMYEGPGKTLHSRSHSTINMHGAEPIDEENPMPARFHPEPSPSAQSINSFGGFFNSQHAAAAGDVSIPGSSMHSRNTSRSELPLQSVLQQRPSHTRQNSNMSSIGYGDRESNDMRGVMKSTGSGHDLMSVGSSSNVMHMPSSNRSSGRYSPVPTNSQQTSAAATAPATTSAATASLVAASGGDGGQSFKWLNQDAIRRGQLPGSRGIRDKTQEEQSADDSKRKSLGAAFVTQKPSVLLRQRTGRRPGAIRRTNSNVKAATAEAAAAAAAAEEGAAGGGGKGPVLRRKISRLGNRGGHNSQLSISDALDLYGAYNQDDRATNGAAATAGTAAAVNDDRDDVSVHSRGNASVMSGVSGVSGVSRGSARVKRIRPVRSFKSKSAMIQEMVSGNLNL